PSELEAALARAVCQRAHAAVVEEAVAVEDHAGDPLLLAAPGREQPDLLRRLHVGGPGERRAQLLGPGGHREQRLLRLIADHLDVDVTATAKHRQPRPVVRATHPPAYAIAAPLARNASPYRHQLLPAAALPAFRRIFSVPYLTPLPLYGSGGRRRRMAAAVWPSSSRSPPSSVTTIWRSTLAVMPGGSWYAIG